MSLNNKFSTRLIELINQKGITRYKVAKDTKITEATLSNYFNEKVNPSPSMVKQLSEYFGVDYNWLLTGEYSREDESSVARDSGSGYRAQRKHYNKTDLKSIIDHFETQLREKDRQIKSLISIIDGKLDDISSKIK